MFGAGAVAVLSVAIAQICCSCSAVFCCVDAKKSADLISQCCASFDPITKYFLFKFVGLIKQSPHSHSQIKEMYKDFSNRQSALQETLFFFSYIDDTVLVMFLSPRCAHHAPRSRVVLMLWIVEILNFDNDNFLFTGLSRWQLEGHYQLLQSMAFVTRLPSKPVNVTHNSCLNIYRFQLLILCKKIFYKWIHSHHQILKCKKLFQKVLDNLLLERVGLYDTGYIHPEATTSSSRGGFHQGFFVEVGIHSESNLSILNPSFI